MTTNRDVKIYYALANHIKTIGQTVIEPGETYPQNLDDWFIVLDDFRNDSPYTFVDDGCSQQYTGIMTANVMMPESFAHKDGLLAAGIVTAHIPEGLELVYDDLKVFIRKSPQFTNGKIRDGAFNRYPVSIYWRCFD